jgi:putative membrane protein
VSQEPIPRLAALGSGVLVLCAVTASPLAMLDHEFLTAHMVQHLLLMTVAAPLLLMGAHRPPAQLVKLTQRITHPVFCWLAGTCTVIAWHIPAAFALGMRSNFWHDVELVSFLAAGLLFWWPVIQPWTGVATWPLWSVPLYLFLATLPCDALSAFLTFCGRLVYPHYAGAASALADQERAGALMWVWVTFVYLAPAVAVAMRILEPRAFREPGRDRRVAGSTTSAHLPYCQGMRLARNKSSLEDKTIH